MSHRRAPVVTLALALAFVATAARAWAAGAGCVPIEAAPGPGMIDPFRAPLPQATALNSEGKTLYRQGQWEAARAQYRAASALDADFLAPRLNVACSFVRQERFAEATAEVIALLQLAPVPWTREVLEAADLGALKVRPEMATVRAAMADSAQRWGQGVGDQVVFLARQRPPLRIPVDGKGVFVLGPHQEAFAWSPTSNRYRQLTATDGRVLAMLTSQDRRRLLYVTAEKLVREADRPPGLRGVTLSRLDLATMSSPPPLPIAGDVTRLEMVAEGPAGFWLKIGGEGNQGTFRLDATSETLAPGPPRPALTRPASDALVVLAPTGSSGPRQSQRAGSCPVVVREVRSASGAPALQIRSPGRPAFLLRPTVGASLSVLPIP